MVAPLVLRRPHLLLPSAPYSRRSRDRLEKLITDISSLTLWTLLLMAEQRAHPPPPHGSSLLARPAFFSILPPSFIPLELFHYISFSLSLSLYLSGSFLFFFSISYSLSWMLFRVLLFVRKESLGGAWREGLVRAATQPSHCSPRQNE